MNEYLKHIFSDLQDYANKEYASPLELADIECKLLLNYITSLQEENKDNLKCIKSLKEQLESVINENQKLLETWHKNNDKNINLISENECLKETNEEHRKINGQLRKDLIVMNNKNMELVRIIDKLKECMEKYKKTSTDDVVTIIEFYNQLENILYKLTELKGGKVE